MKKRQPSKNRRSKLKKSSSVVRNILKVLVATRETQGQRADDFCYANEGELLTFGLECNIDRGPDDCACKRSLIGTASLGATTTMKIAVFKGTINDLADKFPDCSFHDRSDDAIKGKEKNIYRLVATQLGAVSAHSVGTVLERRGETFQARFIPPQTVDLSVANDTDVNSGENEHIVCSPDRGWTCACGNTYADDGFVPCDDEGDQAEPLVDLFWSGPYVCRGCGRIIDQSSLEVLGINPHPIFFSDYFV